MTAKTTAKTTKTKAKKGHLRTQKTALQRKANDRASMKKRVVDAIALGHSVLGASNITGVARSAIYKWVSEDEKFAADMRAAQDKSLDVYEEETYRRAVEGTRDLVIHEGQPVFVWQNDEGEIIPYDSYKEREEFEAAGYKLAPVYKTKYSDTLAIFRMKGLAPEKYADRQVTEISVEIRSVSDAELNGQIAGLLGQSAPLIDITPDTQHEAVD